MLAKTPEATMITDYNPVLAAQTGLYGNARVWVKGIGYIGPHNAQAVAATASPVNIVDPNAVNTATMLASLTQAVTALVAAQTGSKAPELVEPVKEPIADAVDAFAGVGA